MKKLLVFLLIFAISFQKPIAAFAQNSSKDQVHQINQCYDEVFEKFKATYEKQHENMTVEVDDDLRLAFYKSIILFKATKNYNWVLATYVIAAIIYTEIELRVMERAQKFKPIKDVHDLFEAETKVKYFQGKIETWTAEKKLLEDAAKKAEATVTAEAKTALVKNEKEINRLNRLIQNAQKENASGEKFIKLFEKEPAVNRWYVYGSGALLRLGFTVALVVLLVNLDKVPELIGVNNALPVSLETLNKTVSVEEFQRLLASTDEHVMTLRDELDAGCQSLLAIDMDKFFKKYKEDVGPDKILTDLRNIVVTHNEHPLKVKTKPKNQ